MNGPDTNKGFDPEDTLENEQTVPALPGIELQEVLGQGGMGIVYRGYQSLLDRHVAVKFLVPGKDGSSSGSILERFRREARILANLNHPNIVGCYHADIVDDEKLYLVMELIDGPDLAKYLQETGALFRPVALRLIRNVASALQYAYGHGIIHRDIKAANILLRPDEGSGANPDFPFVPKLADLGLARYQKQDEVTQITMAGYLVGTPATMSPEQFDDPEKVDFRSDIYSLGCVFFQVLTGKGLFEGKSLREIVTQKLARDGDILEGVADRLHSDDAALLRQMLARDPKDRPRDYEELLTRIDGLLTVDKSRTLGQERKTKKGPVFAGTAALILVGVTIAAITLTDREKGPAGDEPEIVASVLEQTREQPSPTIPEVSSLQRTSVPTPTTTPTPVPKPTPEPRVQWKEEGSSLFAQDVYNRLDGWTRLQDGSSWGGDQYSSGVIGTKSDGLGMVRMDFGEDFWQIMGNLEPISCTDAGVCVILDDGQQVTLLAQDLGDVTIVRQAVLHASGKSKGAFGTAKSFPKGDGPLAYTVSAMPHQIEFYVNGAPLQTARIESPPSSFALHVKNGSARFEQATLHHPHFME